MRNNRRVPCRASAVFIALAVTFASLGARAADAKKESQALFETAVKQADAGDNAAALSSFRAAYEKFPSFKFLYNIGKVCARVGDAPCAVRAYEQYLRDGAGEVPAKRRKEVEAEIKALSTTLASVRIKSNVTGAEVTIDDVSVGKTPLPGPVAVSGGSHKIVLVHESGKVERSVTVVSGESASLILDVDKDKAGAAPPAAEPSVEEAKPDEEPSTEPPRTLAKESDEPRSFPVVPWVVTGALAATTIVTGILASSAYGDYTSKREEYPISRDDLDGAQASARDLFVLTSVLGAGTVIAAGVATYFTFFSSSSTSGPPPSKSRVGFGVGPGGFSVKGVLP